MKKLFYTFATAALISSTAAMAEQSVAITAIVQHPALDAARDGVIDYLKENGKADVKVTYDSAQGDTTIAAQIAQKYATGDYDVIVAIATPSALAVKTAIEDKPIVFTAVTDPVAAGLISSMDQGEANITGISDLAPVEQQIKMMQELFGNDITIGVPYNPSEANAVSLVELTKEIGQKLNVKIETAAAFTTGEVPQATSKLLSSSNVLYLINDNTIASAADAIIEMANDAEIPTFTASPDMVAQGALISLGTDYYNIGKQTGAQVAQILNGASPKDIKPVVAAASELILNMKTADILGYKFPADILAKATKAIK
ncbi:MAG: ABC transporter substrate-binding protein [Alphaproteobacteria bacterium]